MTSRTLSLLIALALGIAFGIIAGGLSTLA